MRIGPDYRDQRDLSAFGVTRSSQITTPRVRRFGFSVTRKVGLEHRNPGVTHVLRE